LLFGGGLALAALAWERAARAGSVLSAYGALALAGVAILEAVMANEVFRSHTGLANQPLWIISCGVAGVIFAVAAAATASRIGTAFAAGAIGLVLAATAAWTPQQSGDPWLAYAALLCAMLCLVVSGMLDAARPRIVAGWLGIAGVIAAITWAVKGSLLNRSIFLAAAGAVAVALALVLNRFVPRTRE
jgi:branched-subunit amino acid transport protein